MTNLLKAWASMAIAQQQTISQQGALKYKLKGIYELQRSDFGK